MSSSEAPTRSCREPDEAASLADARAESRSLEDEVVSFDYRISSEKTTRISLKGPRGDHLLRQIRETGTFYEADLLRALADEIRQPVDLILDVGANIGNHTAFFSKVLGGSVLCIEPSPLATPYLRANLEANGLTETCEVQEVAAAREAGDLYLDDPRVENLGMSRVTHLPKGERPVQVKGLPIDHIVRKNEFANNRRIDLIKIDVEGFEEDVLAGAEWVLRNHTPMLVVELTTPSSFESIGNALARRGYGSGGPYGATATYIFTKRPGNNAAYLHLLYDNLTDTRLRLTELEMQQESISELRKELGGARGRVRELERQTEEVRESARHRIGDAMVEAASPSLETLKLPWRLWRIYRDAKKRLSSAATAGVPTIITKRRVAERHRQFEKDFKTFVHHVRTVQPSNFVVMYGGTTYIQDIRANRPIRLTRALLEISVPVLFNFHRWRETEHIPPYDTPSLFQSPVDLTPDLLPRLTATDFGSTRCLLVVSYPHPSVPRLINQANVSGWVTLYDCRDDWEEFAKVGAAKWYRESIERFVVNNCDLTCCVSRPLQTKMASYTDNREVRLSPNAYDPNFLTRGYCHNPDEKMIRIGYFGHLTARWFDWESLLWIARQRPQWHFDIIGHGAPDSLALPPNIQLHGPKRHAEICVMASKWSVGIIPFRIGPLADGVDPIKIYEYFGLGLPVVSFRMPQIADYPYTQTVETREAFVEALDRAVELDPDPEVFENFLRKNTWHARAQEMIDWADEMLAHPDTAKSFSTTVRGFR